MPPKAKPGAKPAAAKAKASPAASPPPEEPAPAKSAGPEKLSVHDAETNLNFVEDEDWADLAGTESPQEPVAKVLEALLLLLGDPQAAEWSTATSALEKPEALLRELRALGPWGFSEAQRESATAAIGAADLGRLMKPTAPAAAPAAAKAKAPAAKAGAAKAKAKAGAAPTPAAVAPPPGAPAALALAQLVEAYLAVRASDEKPPAFPMVWPTVPFLQLHRNLQQAMYGQQHACVVCPSEASARATALHCERAGSLLCDIRQLQVKVNLAKSMTPEAARAEIGRVLKEALQRGVRLVLLLGDSPPNLRRYCDSQQVPMDAFEFEKLQEAATALGLDSPAAGFHLVALAELPKARAEKLLQQVIPGFDDMAVMVVDDAALPPGLDEEAQQTRPTCLRSALRLLALEVPPAAAPAAGAAAAGAAASSASASASPVPEDIDAAVNKEDFEYLETFGDDWEDRWSMGPAEKDESGKEIRKGIITAKMVKYPSNPKDAKMCLQLMGGAPNAPCTGFWTTFSPLIRPTEVEFEFTMNGKVDMPNACMVFTEKPFEGALPDCKVGVQFTVRGGMQLCGGGGNMVRISNDGKIHNDKWNKVLIKIDWGEKVAVAQVDTKGKGYAPAIQTVPFRDSSCQGFGALFIYNTDAQATCWFSSLRVKQDRNDVGLDDEALDARRELAERMKQREYERAVAADMEVGMKMGAIKSTKEHGMNLAMEQAANGSGISKG